MNIGIEIVSEKEGRLELAYYEFEPFWKFFAGCTEHGEEITLHYDREHTTMHLSAKCGRSLTIQKGD